jgi:nicotinate-nucleotide adenylyltransferase
MVQRVGIYAGTFDPVHKGHVEFALHAQQSCKLDRVIFLPEQAPRHKHGVTTIARRLQMLRLATMNHSDLEVMELYQDQFTVAETLPELQNRLKNLDLVLLVGSDVAQGMPRWASIEVLVRAMELAVGVRNNTEQTALRSGLDRLVARYTLIDIANSNIASSQIRRLNHYENLDPTVAEYVKAEALYKI